MSSPAHHILALFELPSQLKDLAPKFKTKNMVQVGVFYPIRTLVLSHGSRRRHRSWGFGRTGRAQLQLATAPQGRTPVLGVSGSGHMDEGGFEEPILHAETKAKIPGPPELSRADLARQKGPSTVWPLPETLNTFGRDCAQQNLDDGEGPVLGRQPASQEEDT